MQLQIHLPCSESWDQMSPETEGRHCARCAKTVIDFTEMSAEEISVYLQLHSGTSVCGRFTTDQLEQSIPAPREYVMHVLRAPLPFLKQIAALIIFALFIGANPAVAQTGKQQQHKRTTIQGAPLQQVKQPRPVTGKVSPPKPALPQPAQPTEPRPVMGDVAIAPDPPPPTIMGGVRPIQTPPATQPKQK